MLVQGVAPIDVGVGCISHVTVNIMLPKKEILGSFRGNGICPECGCPTLERSAAVILVSLYKFIYTADGSVEVCEVLTIEAFQYHLLCSPEVVRG